MALPSALDEDALAMATTSKKSANQSPSSAWLPHLALVLLAGIVAYSSSLAGDYVFDDVTEIEQNPLLGQIWPPWRVLESGNFLPVRPLPQWTFGLQSHFTGIDRTALHVVNLLIHLTTATLLLLLVKMSLDFWCERGGKLDLTSRWTLAASVAAIWVVHPLNTQAVTYIYQRIESLMAMFFIASLVCFAHSVRSHRRLIWQAFAVVCSIGGMLCKEVTITLPLLVYLYDAIFVADGFADAIRKRWKFHAALHATILVVIAVVLAERGDYEEFNDAVHTPLEHAITQPLVILYYLKLVVLPIGQCFDYGWPVQEVNATMGLSMATIFGMFVAACVLVWRRHPLGFAAISFFAILSPSSSFVPVSDMAFEHRMYLPLMAVIAIAILPLGIWLLAARANQQTDKSNAKPARYGSIFVARIAAGILVVIFAATTFARNEAYETRTKLWEDVVTKRPHNARAWSNLSRLRFDAGDFDGAYAAAVRSIREKPSLFQAYGHLSRACVRLGLSDEAIAACEMAIELSPEEAVAYYQYGIALRGVDEAKAIEAYQKAIELEPTYSEAHNNLGAMLIKRDPDLAAKHLKLAIEANPANVQAWINFGNLLGETGNFERAVLAYDQALAQAPEEPTALRNRAIVLRLAQEAKTGSAN